MADSGKEMEKFPHPNLSEKKGEKEKKIEGEKKETKIFRNFRF